MVSTVTPGVQPGIYEVDYFSGAQVAIYIGDVLVDEVTSITYQVSQHRTPLYGYASQLFDALTAGPVIVQGNFTINFKEAGYLWFILQRYQNIIGAKNPPIASLNDGLRERTFDMNPEMKADRGQSQYVNPALIAWEVANKIINKDQASQLQDTARANTGRKLGGYSSIARAQGGMGVAENVYEYFEDKIWASQAAQEDLNEGRRADSNNLNPFEIYVAYGDYTGDNRLNHTIRKLAQVNIVGTAQQIVYDGMPIQEQYNFIARNII
jgi:hypothetical protein